MKKLGIGILSTAIVVAMATPNLVQAEPYNAYNLLWDMDYGTDAVPAISLSQMSGLSPGRGSVAYIPSYAVTGSTALYELVSPSGTDHMVSFSTNEGGYSEVGPLGFGYNSSSALRGLSAMQRFYDASNGDHMWNLATTSRAGYSAEGPQLYGFPQYGLATSQNNTLTSGGVSIASNSMAGGAIFSWTWNGVQFIDTTDYGRELQSSVAWLENSVWHNPTEAGDEYSTSSPAWKNHGSPTYWNYNSGSTQSTRSIPMEFTPEKWGGGQNTAIIYDQMLLGKDITLNYNNMGPVAQYVTHLTSATSLPSANIEIPTGYMPSSTFNTFYTYDAVSQTLTNVSPPTGCSAGYWYTPSSGYGGVIISNSSGTYAMGVYGKLTSLSGSVSRFSLWSCNATSKWNAEADGVSGGSDEQFTTFVMSGTLANVESYMRQLYTSGAL